MIESFITAAKTGDLSTVETLLKQGINLNAQNAQGDTALLWAAYEGHVTVVKLLLTHGADPNIPDRLGNTPLHWAMFNHHVEVMSELLKYGANTALKNKSGLTAQEFARAHHKASTHQLTQTIEANMHERALLKTHFEQIETNQKMDDLSEILTVKE